MKEFTYAKSGVDRELRAKSKNVLTKLKETYKFSSYGDVVHLPYSNIFPFGKGRYLDLEIEGVGTKVLVAQLAEKYDTIGIDAVAMAVNDVIRSGAKPLALVDNIHAHASSPSLTEAWVASIAKGASEAECIVPNGEIGDVGELIRGVSEGTGFDMIVASVGEVRRQDVISGKNVRPGDPIIGVQSFGLHSNGISLARRVLFKRWGGKYEPYDKPDDLEKELVLEVLKPTRIYVRPFLQVTRQIEVKAAVHITGDAYLKFGNLAKFSKGIGFHFDNFSPQPIFELIRRTASDLRGKITDKEMFRTFNMGWGFALVTNAAASEEAIRILRKNHMRAEQIGSITDSGGIRISYKGTKINLL